MTKTLTFQHDSFIWKNPYPDVKKKEVVKIL